MAMSAKNIFQKPWVPWAAVTLLAVLGGAGASGVVGVLAALPEGADAGDALVADGATAPTDDVSVSTDAPAVEPAPGEAVTDGASEVASVRPRARRLSEKEYKESILGRNLFDPAAVDRGIRPECEGEDCEGAVASELRVQLRGTVVAIPSAFSAAWIAEEGQQTPKIYAIGDKVQGAEVVEIADKAVRFRLAGGAEEWVVMGQEAPKSTTTEPAAGGDVTSADGVKQNGENDFEISRDKLNAALDDPTALAGMARALLHRGPDGEYDGYRLSAIRRGTLPDMVGIRNGDIIHSVNGMSIDSLDGAMKALEALRSESNLKVEVTRRGQPTSLNYSVR